MLKYKEGRILFTEAVTNLENLHRNCRVADCKIDEKENLSSEILS